MKVNAESRCRQKDCRVPLGQQGGAVVDIVGSPHLTSSHQERLNSDRGLSLWNLYILLIAWFRTSSDTTQVWHIFCHIGRLSLSAVEGFYLPIYVIMLFSGWSVSVLVPAGAMFCFARGLTSDFLPLTQGKRATSKRNRLLRSLAASTCPLLNIRSIVLLLLDNVDRRCRCRFIVVNVPSAQAQEQFHTLMNYRALPSIKAVTHVMQDSGSRPRGSEAAGTVLEADWIMTAQGL